MMNPSHAYFIIIRLYGTYSTPHIFPNILTPMVFVLEYISELVEMDDIHFMRRKKKTKLHFPMSIGGYVTNDKRCIKDSLEDLKQINLPLDQTIRPTLLVGG